MKLENLMKFNLCDNCLGRQAAQLISGFTNEERGRSIRNSVAMRIDSGEKIDLDMSNFHGYNFRHAKVDAKKEPCFICSGVFEKLEPYMENIAERVKGIEFSTFLVGTRPTPKMVKNEEKVWEENGIEWTEPIKGNINRVIGSALEKRLRKKANFNRPDIVILLDLEKKRVSIEINSVFIYGEYNKLRRNIPQTKWPSGKYKTSVEEIVAKDFMKKMKGKGHKFHGAGREDIDALCLGWRPFVLEITEPEVRRISLKDVKVGPGVEVRKLKYTDSKMPERVKTLDHDKTYRALAVFEKNVDEKELKKLGQLRGKTVLQETPNRVLHRRGDLIRKRKIHSITWKKISPRKVEFRIKAQSGTYIKELISGDKGRTYPSISQILENKGICRELDVIGFYKRK